MTCSGFKLGMRNILSAKNAAQITITQFEEMNASTLSKGAKPRNNLPTHILNTQDEDRTRVECKYTSGIGLDENFERFGHTPYKMILGLHCYKSSPCQSSPVN